MPKDITEPPFKHSKTLFTVDRRPMHFFLRPCTQRRKLRGVIEGPDNMDRVRLVLRWPKQRRYVAADTRIYRNSKVTNRLDDIQSQLIKMGVPHLKPP